MGLYDEIYVAKNCKVNIPQAMDCYQTNSLDGALRNLTIDEDGKITYNVEPEKVISTLQLFVYGEDDTGYCRQYEMMVLNNQIVDVIEDMDGLSFA